MSPFWSWVVMGALAAGVIVLALALARSATKGDRMSQRWLEEQWLKDHEEELP